METLERTCGWCSGSMEHKRRGAVYCSRECKVRASDRRRVEDGRAHARDRARYATEAEHRRAYASQYLKDNPERMRAIRRRRKGQLRARAYVFTERDWVRLVARYDGCCAYCGQESETLHREHIIPLCRGGTHSIGNIIPACAPCNYSKHRMTIMEWRLRQRRSVRR